jgi:hypothetical protein
MPSSRHDSLVRMFCDRPAAVGELLREFAHRDLPDGDLTLISTAALNDRPSAELIPDSVFAVGQARDPKHVVVVEVQHAATQDKHLQMARYAAALWLFYRCRITVLVICTDQQAAGFYSQPLATGLEDYIFFAATLGPDGLPIITDPSEVAARPDIAAVAVAAHPTLRTIRAFFQGLREMPQEAVDKYIEDAHRICAPDARSLMEEIMPESPWVVSTPFAKEHFGRGRAEGLAEGRAEGQALGFLAGEAKGEAQALLAVLNARHIWHSADHLARVLDCTDLDQLNAWLLRAATATKIEEVFD